MTFYLKIFPTSGKHFPAPHRCMYLLADSFYCVLQQKKPHLEYIWTGLVIIIFLLEQNENCCLVLPRGGVCRYDRCGGSLPCGQMLDIPGNRTQAWYSSTYLTTTPSSSFISKVQGRTKTFSQQICLHTCWGLSLWLRWLVRASEVMIPADTIVMRSGANLFSQGVSRANSNIVSCYRNWASH